MPARNSADAAAQSSSHPFDCPAGDGGQCTLPRPPLKVEGGQLRIVQVDGDGVGVALRPDGLRPLHGRRREALNRLLDHSATSEAALPDGLLVSCTCGHLYLSGGG